MSDLPPDLTPESGVAAPPPPPPPPAMSYPYWPPQPGSQPWGGYQMPAGYQPAQPYWWTPPEAAPPAPPRMGPRLLVAILAMVVLIAAAAGIAAGLTAHRAATGSLPAPLPGSSSGTGGSSGGSGNGTGGGGASGTAQQIATQVDPSIVDITTTYPGHSGGGAGTGIILTTNGLILTNNHVIEGAAGIKVQVAGTGPMYDGTVVGDDPADDVAVVQISNASGLTPGNFGDSSTVQVGDHVVALGNALGLGGPPAIAEGTVTGLDRTITASDPGMATETLHGMIETNAPIQPGDSGGPLVNGNAQIIGIDAAGSTSSRRVGGTTDGYAVPINTALSIAKQIESGDASGNVQIGPGPLLGVEVGDSTSTPGAAVQAVTPNSPAAGAGIVPGDVITDVDGTTIDSVSALGTVLKKHRVGDQVTVTWLDPSGQSHSATVTLAPGPPA